ncbi:hypothetical protein [Cellulomonas sp. ES6]|uniref:hypothetical protein n=1 Tax=Cellulomonas sp. ES6 TaxID=3039384 RepID=UPI0024B6FBCB|nr:hypothetical protein [Cellulomonas sp. ES6]WHP18812.1 hypothetical protein P9841_06765 [Cellulomonas sp. ES6]
MSGKRAASAPSWAKTTNSWKHDGEGQDFFHYGPEHRTAALDGSGEVAVTMQRNEYRLYTGEVRVSDSVGVWTVGDANLTTDQARAVAHQLIVASRCLEDEAPPWGKPGDWGVDVDGSRTRFTDGLSFEVEGHDGSMSARMEKFEYQPGPAGGDPKTTYLITTGPDVAFTADQARRIGDEFIRYAALLDAFEEADR